jgi:hypothetical protein
MLPTIETGGQPHRDLDTFRVYDGQRVFVGAESPDGIMHEKLRVEEPGRYALVPLPDDLDERVVDGTELEEDVDLADMRIIGQAYGIQADGDAIAELRIEGEGLSSYSYAGLYGLLHVPFDD